MLNSAPMADKDTVNPDELIAQMSELEKKKDAAIKELLRQREEIDRKLAVLGYAKRGRKPGSSTKGKKKDESK